MSYHWYERIIAQRWDDLVKEQNDHRLTKSMYEIEKRGMAEAKRRDDEINLLKINSLNACIESLEKQNAGLLELLLQKNK